MTCRKDDMLMIELVITDLDGSLLDNESKISDKNIKAIKKIKRNNILFGIASGRALTVIENIAKKYKIDDCIDIMIGTNGVELSDLNILEDVEVNYLKKEIIIDLAKKYENYDVAFVVHDGNKMISNKANSYTEMERKLNNYIQVVESDIHKLINKDFPRLMMVGEPTVLNEIALDMAMETKRSYNFFKSYAYFLEVVSSEVSKGIMLKQYCDNKGIDINKVLSVGDNDNDIEMVKLCGYGTAVSNATAHLKECAKHITSSSNHYSGFAEAVNHFI